jgi:hypothetical protein
LIRYRGNVNMQRVSYLRIWWVCPGTWPYLVTRKQVTI